MGLIGLLIVLSFLIMNISCYKRVLANFALLAALSLVVNSMKSSSVIDLRLFFALFSMAIFHYNRKTIKD
jgi:hypothetical protein